MSKSTARKVHKFTQRIVFCDSSWINHVQYDPETLKLDVTTNSGHKYRYQGVGTDEFSKLITAESQGAYFNDRIKGKYRSKRLRVGSAPTFGQSGIIPISNAA